MAPGSTSSQQPNPFIVTFQTGKPYKVHKSYIWVAPLTMLAIVLIVGLANSAEGLIELGLAVSSHSMEVNLLLIIACGIAVIVVLFGILVAIYALSYKHMSYVFDPREFSFYSGVFVKKRVHLPYEKVQSVNKKASLIQRIFGVCTVTIDSAGGSANKGVRVPYVRLQIAERINADLFIRKAAEAAGMPVVYAPQHDDEAMTAGFVGSFEPGRTPVVPWEGAASTDPRTASGPSATPGFEPSVQPGSLQGAMVGPGPSTLPGSAQAPMPAFNTLDDVADPVSQWRGLYGGAGFIDEPVTFEYGLTNGQLIFAGLSHPGALIGGLITAACLFVFAVVAVFSGEWFLLGISAALVPLIVIGTVFVWVLASVGIILGYGGFKVRRRGTRIEVERGIITRHSSGIDVDRVQYIEVHQSLIRRLFGYCEISFGRIDTSSQDSSQNSNSAATGKLLIHPFVKLSHVNAILDGLVPEFSDRPVRSELAPLPPVALRRALLRRCFLYNWVLWPALIISATLALVLAVAPGGEEVMVSGFTWGDSLVAMIWMLGIITVIATVLFAVSAALWARQSAFGWSHRFLVLHNDGLYTATCIVPRQKIQSGATRDNPFQRRLSLTAIQAVTAAGTGNGTVLQLFDVPAASGSAYLEWLE